MALTEKQRRFIDNYVATANATEAAKRSGYSPKTAFAIGNENLNKPEIRKAIGARLNDLASKRIADAQESMEYLTSVMRGEKQEIVVTQSGKKIKVPPKICDRNRAAELILKVHGAFKEKVDVEVSGADLFVQTLEKVWANNNADENPSNTER